MAIDPAVGVSSVTSLHRRPHYRVRDGALYFLASTRPVTRLSPDEIFAWEALAAETSPQVIGARHGPGVHTALARLTELQVCDAVGAFPSGRRKVVVIEPHSDDAALSIGATMWLLRNDVEFTLVTVASRSNFTSYFMTARDFFRVAEVTSIRNEEGAAFMRLLGGHHIALGLNEATLRYRDADWSLDYFRSNRVSVSSFNNRQAPPEDLEQWKAALQPVLAGLKGAELWLPIGVGNHADHELTRNACLSLLGDDPGLASDSAIRLYQDVPYDTKHAGHLERILEELAKAGARLVHEPMQVDRAYERKLELLSVYASQFKVPAIAEEVHESSRARVGGGRCEHLYRLEQRPRQLPMLGMTLRAPDVQAALRHVHRWLERHREARRIRILSVVPPGRWKDDVASLAAAFPRARFELYAPPAATAEADRVVSDRVDVRHVPGGSTGWIATALRVAVSRPSPTLLVCGERSREARVLARLWPLSDAVIVPSMDTFMLALALLTEGGDRR